VPDFTRSMIVSGSTKNFLIVKDGPFLETSLSSAWSLKPSGSMPSATGLATEICCPDMLTNLTTYDSSSSMVLKIMLVGMDS